MKIAIVVLAAILGGCATTKYANIYEGGYSLEPQASKGKTVGIVPMYWTETGKKYGVDQIQEARLLALAKVELERRGYRAVYIPRKYLRYDTSGISIIAISDPPPMILNVMFSEYFAGMVNHPGTSSGYISGGRYIGLQGAYSSTDGYKTPSYWLSVAYMLLAGDSAYENVVWRGENRRGSGSPDLDQQAPDMTTAIFSKVFDRR